MSNARVARVSVLAAGRLELVLAVVAGENGPRWTLDTSTGAMFVVLSITYGLT